MSRRGLRGGLAGAGVVAAVASVPAMALVQDAIAHVDLPWIVGDGIHDDTVGLQAAIDGKPFVSDVVKVIEVDGRRTVLLGKGEFRIGSAVELADVHDMTIDGGTLVAEGDCAINFKGMTRNVTVQNMCIKMRPRHINPTARAMQISYGGAV